ncbi:hypothetical protein [Chryseosolibacter indicus]|nr:hypothetical protein [Chryseosolibacter indicus]
MFISFITSVFCSALSPQFMPEDWSREEVELIVIEGTIWYCIQ